MSVILNHLPIMNCTRIARKMAEIPSLSHGTYVQEILRSIVNLLGEHVEEVFQRIAIMPQISSFVLECMEGLLSDSRDVFFRIGDGKHPIGRLPNRSVNLLVGVV